MFVQLERRFRPGDPLDLGGVVFLENEIEVPLAEPSKSVQAGIEKAKRSIGHGQANHFSEFQL